MMKYRNKYIATAVAGGTVIGAAYILPREAFQAFVLGWLFLIPVAVAVFLAYGLREYMKDRNNRIMVSIRPSDAMKAIARREAELQREKELLYEELSKGVKR
ncbi:MAG: hypothetical protein FIB08_10950 [Candidatus Methanoperedens sp.]|nr:hypothetical protein [Candidatus Methanoperedens sp.]